MHEMVDVEMNSWVFVSRVMRVQVGMKMYGTIDGNFLLYDIRSLCHCDGGERQKRWTFDYLDSVESSMLCSETMLRHASRTGWSHHCLRAVHNLWTSDPRLQRHQKAS